jgi:hypothetical protein
VNANLEKIKELSIFLKPEALSRFYSFSWLSQKVPQTGLVEFQGSYGSGKTEAVLQFLKENPALKVAWIEKDFTIFPGAFPLYQIELTRILFLDLSLGPSSQSPFWCAAQLLKSQIFPVLVFSHFSFSEKDLRRLQLLTKKTGKLIFFLQDVNSASVSWPFSLKIQVQRSSQAPWEPLLTSLK